MKLDFSYFLVGGFGGGSGGCLEVVEVGGGKGKLGFGECCCEELVVDDGDLAIDYVNVIRNNGGFLNQLVGEGELVEPDEPGPPQNLTTHLVRPGQVIRLMYPVVQWSSSPPVIQ